MISVFSKEQVSAVSDYVSYVLEMLNLTDWEVKLNHEPADVGGSDAAASIKTIYGRRSATLRLCHDFFALPVKEMEHYLTHEICHLLGSEVDDVIDHCGAEQLMGKPAFTVFRNSYILHSERMIDHIAVTVLQLLEDGTRRSEVVTALDAARETS